MLVDKIVEVIKEVPREVVKEVVINKVHEEIVFNSNRPTSQVSFGTSGWRGILGKDLFCKSVAQVSLAIVEMYKDLETQEELKELLGVENFAEACQKGCVIGFDGSDTCSNVLKVYTCFNSWNRSDGKSKSKSCSP